MHYVADGHVDDDAEDIDDAELLAEMKTASLEALNYDVRVLGRKGVLGLNAVGRMDQLGEIGPAMESR